MQIRHRGFTLLEIIIVLSLIGLVATIILPALRRTNKAAMRDSIQNLTSQITLSYDNALFTGRVHRMVFDVQKGKFWTEIAPKDYTGRAPTQSEENESRKKSKEALYLRLSDEAKSAKATENPLLEIPAHQREILKELSWTALQTNLIEPKELVDGVVFVQISSGLSPAPVAYQFGSLTFSQPSDQPTDSKYLVYVYFFPNATSTPLSIQLGFKQENTLDRNAEKYTLNLNTLTGRVKLLEGLQESNFELSQ